MLFGYFLKKLYFFFFLFLVGISFLFASGDLFSRVLILPPGLLFFMFACFMFPLMVLHAIPLASACSVAFVTLQLFVKDEFMFLRFLPEARKALVKAVLFFSCSLLLTIVPLLFSWVPQSYLRGKQFLATSAYHHLDCLQQQKWHKIAPGFTTRFESKEKDEEGALILKSTIIRFKEKNKTDFYLIFAERGKLQNGILFLYDGRINTHLGKEFSLGTFTCMQIDLEQITGLADFYKPETCTKFLMSSQLLDQKDHDYLSLLELHKRWAQLLWNILIPFITLWFMIAFMSKIHTFIMPLSFVGLLFLLFYFSTNSVGSCYQYPWLVYGILYIIPLLGSLYFFWRSEKSW